MECIVFIESNTSGTGKIFIQEAIKEGYQPILFATNPSLYTFIDEMSEQIKVINVDTLDDNKIRESINLLGDGIVVSGMISSSDYYVEIAARVAEKLSLPHFNYKSIKICRNKGLQRLKLEENAIPQPHFNLCKNITEVEAALDSIQFPIVVKPIMGSGSVGVKYCQTREDAISHAIQLLNKKTNERNIPIDSSLLIEEYIEGRELSVEVFNGKVIGITQKYVSEPPFFIEVGHDFPATLTMGEGKSIEETVSKIVDCLSFNNGVLHIELKLTKGGVKVIEINPRLAGGYIPELIKLSYGIDLISESIKFIIGKGNQEIKPQKNQFSCIRFLKGEGTGEIRELLHPDKLNRQYPDVKVQMYKKAGDKITINGDFRDRIGHVISWGPSIEAATTTAENALKDIKMTIC